MRRDDETGGVVPLPTPPIEPMLAKLADALPDEPGFSFEPKCDGFRCLIFRAGKAIELQ